MFGLNLLLFIMALAPYILAAEHKEGYCSMYGTCGKKTVFGSELPCANSVEAVKPSERSIELLKKVCGSDYPTDQVCCSEDQILSLESNFNRVGPLISSCPACKKNFFDFFCEFSCSPNQSKFTEVTKTSAAIDTGNEVVLEIILYIDPQSAKKFFDSCKEMKFLATNGYVMDLIGGGAKDYTQFLKFLGDEKPLLGGSPFQINFAYNTSTEDGVQLRAPEYKDCNDADYSCACSDCSSWCPKLPHFRNFKEKCKVGKLPCFSFATLVIWLCIFLTIAGYHVHNYRTRQKVWDYDDNDIANVRSHGVTHKTSFGLRRKWTWNTRGIFEKVAFFSASHPKKVIVTGILLAAFFSLGLINLQIETDPKNLWVSPSDPALEQFNYFNENFGEWYRIEQIIVSDDKPILTWDNINWWFEKEQELKALRGIELSDICFKPLDEACAIESFTQYFQGDINYIDESNWKQKLKECTDSPVNCLPAFQQPLKKNLLFDSDDIFDARAFTVTVLVNNNLTNDEYTSKAIDYEHGLQKWISKIKQERDLQISYSTEISLVEELSRPTNTAKVNVISYLLMFLYVSLALGGRFPTNLASLGKVRFQLGLSGILIILLSVTSSAGILSTFGLKCSLIIAEVIPFLILAVGVDGFFLIVHEFHNVNQYFPENSVEENISTTMGNIGPSCLIGCILQVSMFLLASRVDILKNFAFFSSLAVILNFIFQMSSFLALLAVDQRHLLNGLPDIIPFLHISSFVNVQDTERISVINSEGTTIDADDEEFAESGLADIIGRSYAPFILSKANGKKVLAIFVLWLGVSLSLLPRILLGMDQRLAIPSDSHLVDYFNDIYEYLNVGPPVFFVMKDLDVTKRENQQNICGRFSACSRYSVSNILTQEYNRGKKSDIGDPPTNWIDDFFTWLNPDLDECCRVKKNSPFEFCPPNASSRMCQTCYMDHDPPYDLSMEGFPEGKEFMHYFNHWIEQPSDQCSLGGKAPYSTSVSLSKKNITASYFRTSHVPLRSQDDFINAYKNSRRIVSEIKHYNPELDIYAFLPFYIYFVQYHNIISLTFTLLAVGILILWIISTISLGTFRTGTVLAITIASILINIGGLLSTWSITLNAVTLVNLIICIGLSVEFTVHIARAYTVSPPTLLFPYEIFLGQIADARSIKAYNSLVTIGSTVIRGITLTKIIGVSVLAFSSSKIFVVFYFRMWITLIVVGAIHAFCLLPVLLSIFGDTGNHRTEKVQDGLDSPVLNATAS